MVQFTRPSCAPNIARSTTASKPAAAVPTSEAPAGLTTVTTHNWDAAFAGDGNEPGEGGGNENGNDPGPAEGLVTQLTNRLSSIFTAPAGATPAETGAAAVMSANYPERLLRLIACAPATPTSARLLVQRPS